MPSKLPLSVSIAIFACTILAAPHAALGTDVNEPAAVCTEAVDAIFEEVTGQDTPGAALAIIQNGAVIYKNGYGLSNLEYDIPITPATIFHVASVSKQFTAFAIDLLEAEGKLSLDDDIHKYVPEVPDFGKTITIRHLIHHTSGLRDQWQLLAMAGWRLDDVITGEHIMKMVRHQKELNFDPGAEYLYCNTGYTLLAKIVERVSGQSFRDYTAAHIFAPLGMEHTHFHDDHQHIVKNRAYSYSRNGDNGFKKSVLSFANVGATSLFTTVEDLAKWMLNFEDARVGGPALIERMQERGVLTDGTKLEYAHGLVISPYRGLTTVGHNGADAGFRSTVIWFPDERFGVVVLCNLGTMSPRQLAERVADVYLADRLAPRPPAPKKPAPAPVQVDPKAYDQYVGKYQLPGITISITKEDERLMGQATDLPKLELRPEAENRFSVEIEGDKTQLTFEKNDAGRVTRLVIHQDGQDMTAERSDGAISNTEQLREFVGDYYSDELGTVYTLVVENDKLIARHRRHDNITLRFGGRDRFFGSAWWFPEVDFQRDSAGTITGFRLTGGRVRNLWFEKLESRLR